MEPLTTRLLLRTSPQGNFMREMLVTVRHKGPAGLYWGFLPHCFEALPHDISEMLVMGCMKVGGALQP